MLRTVMALPHSHNDAFIHTGPRCHVSDAGLSTISCGVNVERKEAGVVLTSLLAADDSVLCTGTYALTGDDVDNLGRESLVTVSAQDKYGNDVVASVAETVTLEQVRSVRIISRCTHCYCRCRPATRHHNPSRRDVLVHGYPLGVVCGQNCTIYDLRDEIMPRP